MISTVVITSATPLRLRCRVATFGRLTLACGRMDRPDEVVYREALCHHLCVLGPLRLGDQFPGSLQALFSRLSQQRLFLLEPY